MKLEAQRAILIGAALVGYGLAALLWSDQRLRQWGIDWRKTWHPETLDTARERMIREENMVPEPEEAEGA